MSLIVGQKASAAAHLALKLAAHARSSWSATNLLVTCNFCSNLLDTRNCAYSSKLITRYSLFVRRGKLCCGGLPPICFAWYYLLLVFGFVQVSKQLETQTQLDDRNCAAVDCRHFSQAPNWLQDTLANNHSDCANHNLYVSSELMVRNRIHAPNILNFVSS